MFIIQLLGITIVNKCIRKSTHYAVSLNKLMYLFKIRFHWLWMAVLKMSIHVNSA